jgi:enterochelin esterase-like enzyme
VYLPANYNQEEGAYATIYLLHGYGDDETAWIDDGRIDRIINELENNGTIEPMIYVIPQGFNSYYVNRFDGTMDYMRMFTDELVPLIDSLYHTKKDKSQRAVVGYSMGGYGALILPVKNPDIFSISVPLSMSFRTDEQYINESQSAFDKQWGPIFGNTGASGTERLTAYYKSHSPFHFFYENTSDFSDIKFFIDCGDDEESLSITNNTLHQLMSIKSIDHEYRMRNGAHTWDYWRASMREALPYIHACFKGNPYPKETGLTTSESFAGRLEQKSFSNITLNIGLPAGYNMCDAVYPVAYFYHQVKTDRLKETKNTLAVLDSLQKEKNFILVEIDTEDVKQKNIDFKLLVEFIDSKYRTKTKIHNRIGIGNLCGGELIYNASVEYPDLLYSLFLFDTSQKADINAPEAKFIYLDCTDKGVNFASMHQLYVQCRNRDIDHQFRVRNGKDSFNSFLNGLDNSTTYIGLMLNKL